ncbi:MAG: SDR family oxidoreductase [Myxococcales bacterium]|nr:SDR family oxidoreductase [Myxococcales bacterium]
MELRDKSAIVTGSATGVGRETALALGRLGCNVIINYTRSRAEAEQTGADVAALGVKVEVVQADVSVDADCKRLVETATAHFGGLDVLVNNAGTTSFINHADLDGVGDEDWTRIMAVNVQGPFQMARAAREALSAGDGGAIVNVSSIAGLRAIGSSIPYCASKAALNNLTVALARVLSPKVRVNAVAPGFITGRWLQGGLGGAYDIAKAANEKRAPLQRVCDPKDVADAILSLITGSSMITGHIVPVEGGLLIGG